MTPSGIETISGTTAAERARPLVCCRACGLIQTGPQTRVFETLDRPRAAPVRLFCARCDARIEPHADARRHALRNRWAAALALAALVIYPAALSLPMLRIERFGHTTDTTIREGVVALVRDGHVAVGVLVFVCSVLAPALKLAAILVLVWASGWRAMFRISSRKLDGAPDARPFAAPEHQQMGLTPALRRKLHQAVEFLGRWGMLDVMLVAVLVAAVKLGDLMSVSPGAGVFLYAAMVVLSLLASAAFDPRALWAAEAPTLEGVRSTTTAPNHERTA